MFRNSRAPLGAVVIGRNEGARLDLCLRSVCGQAEHVVYVDSGSSDGSVEMARALGVAVVELDLNVPFTAARARNAGFQALLSAQPLLDYVFFVDGDCEVAEGFLGKACGFLAQHPEFAVVWGMRRERYPEKSVYNMLCNIEWDLPIGESKYCGGDAVMRVKPFQAAQGYRADLICGEEPELCVRLRMQGWHIYHLPDTMTIHDAAIYRFGQWWRRMTRSGYAYALGAALHGAPPERHWVRESRRIWFWGLILPAAVLIAALEFGWWPLVLLAVYPLQFLRIGVRGPRTPRENWWWAGAVVLAKFPEMVGQMRFLLDRYFRAQSRLIEYK
jgi:glycosyltransferase involved in cell wall biosynthesis